MLNLAHYCIDSHLSSVDDECPNIRDDSTERRNGGGLYLSEVPESVEPNLEPVDKDYSSSVEERHEPTQLLLVLNQVINISFKVSRDIPLPAIEAGSPQPACTYCHRSGQRIRKLGAPQSAA